MKLIGPGPKDDVDNAAGVAAAFGVGLGLGGKLIDRIQRHDRAGNTGDAALVDGRNVVPEVVVIDPINLPVHLVGAGAIQRAETAYGVSTVARLHSSELREVAPVHGHVLHCLCSQDVVLRCSGRRKRQSRR